MNTIQEDKTIESIFISADIPGKIILSIYIVHDYGEIN